MAARATISEWFVRLILNRCIKPTHYGDSMIKLVALALVSFVSFSATASDHWDTCSSADGYVKIDHGALFIEGIGETTFDKLEVVSTIKDELVKCTLKGSKTEVVSLINKVTVEQVHYRTEENEPLTLVLLLCERGGSGIPAGDECK